MGFVKHNNGFAVQFFGDHVGHFRVQHVLVIENHYVGVRDCMACYKIWAPFFFFAKSLQIVQRVNGGGVGGGGTQGKIRTFTVKGFKIIAMGLVFIGSDKGRGQFAARTVDPFGIRMAYDVFVDAHVSSRRQTYGGDVVGGLLLFRLQFRVACFDDAFEFDHCFGHFWHRTGAVDEFAHFFGPLKLVGGDEGEQGDGFAGAGGHFQEAIAFGVEGLFEFAHVLVLFGVDTVEGPVDDEVFDEELHGVGGVAEGWWDEGW